MTLGEKWQNAITQKTDKEILFEELERRVNKAIEEKRKTIWISYGERYNEISFTKKILKEFADINGLDLIEKNKSGWWLSPKKN